MVDRSEVLARKILGSILAGFILLSALGILGLAPTLLIPVKVANAQLTAQNISSITTSRDGPPFNGKVYYNATFQVNITFANPINVTEYPNVNISMWILDNNGVKLVLNNITAWPINESAALVFIYNVTIFINESGIFIGNLTGSSTDLADFTKVSSIRLTEGDVIVLGNYTTTTPVTSAFTEFKRLIFEHTRASDVRGIPSSVAPAPLGLIGLTENFSITAPDLNKFWNVRDNTTILLNIQNDTGFILIPAGNASLDLTETGVNTGVFRNTTVNTLGALFPDNASYRLDPGRYNLTIYVPIYNVSSDDYDTITFEVINVSFTVGVPPPVALITDRDYIPATVDYDLLLNLTIVDPSVLSPDNIIFGNLTQYNIGNANLTVVFHNYLGQPVKTTVPIEAIVSLTTRQTLGTGIFSLWFSISRLAFQYPFEVQNGFLRILYRSPSGGELTKDLPIRTVDVAITVNGSQSLSAGYGSAVNITVINPAASVNMSSINTLRLTVLGATVPASGVVTLNETAPGSGVFSAILWIGDDANISANPESIIEFRYIHNTSPQTPLGSTTWISATVKVNVKITSTPGIILSPSDGSRTGPIGKLNITIIDQDGNRRIFSNDTITFNIKFWDGRVATFTAEERGPNTGIFTAIIDKSDLGSVAELLRGRTIQIVYSDAFSPTGPFSTAVTIYFVSMDGVVTLDKSFYLPGQQITIRVDDSDAATDPTIIESITVRVTSTSDPTGIVVQLLETAPDSGVFVGQVLISSNTFDRGTPGIIFANIGDTITVVYTDQFPEDYATTGRSKDISATAFVGELLEKPIAISPTLVISTLDGTPATTIIAGQLYLISVNLTNNNPIPVSFTVLFLVLDPTGTPVQVQLQSTTLGPGQSVSIGFSVTFPSQGEYTVRIVVVKSIADQTPLADRFEQVVRVVS